MAHGKMAVACTQLATASPPPREMCGSPGGSRHSPRLLEDDLFNAIEGIPGARHHVKTVQTVERCLRSGGHGHWMIRFTRRRAWT